MAPSARIADGKSYKHIMNATTMIAGSSVVHILFGLIRTKSFAVLLGPTGVGLIGIYSLVAELVQSVAALGVQSSGVRQIAEAAGSDDVSKVARTVTVLRRLSVLLAVTGALLLILASKPIAGITFGDQTQVEGLMLLAAAVFLRTISAGQEALLQGLRRISDLARIRMWAALLSTVLAITITYYLREDGIVPAIISMAAASVLASWWYSRKIDISKPRMTASEMLPEAASLLRLGVAFMASGLLTIGAAYAIRVIVLQSEGFAAAGLYQAAWTLGGLYTGFILQAMGTDFYPRLTAAARNNEECNRLVNEQAYISILLAGPGVIATLTYAPIILPIFYSADFHAAADAVRWICAGMMLRVIAWPVGYVVLAKGAQQIFFWTEVAAAVIHVGLAWLLTERFGYTGAAVAFFGLYLWHSVLIYSAVRWLSGFRWSGENRRLVALYIFATGVVLCGSQVLPLWASLAVGSLVTFITSLHTLRVLLALYSPKWLPDWLKTWSRETSSVP